jgi:high potential iron-sulfur protein
LKPTDIRRRVLLKAGALGSVLLTVGTSARAPAQENKPRLDEKEPQALQLGYRHDATTVDKKKFPSYKPGEVCGNCQFFQSKGASEEWVPCSMFPGRQVNVNGWCSSYMKRTS